MFQTNPLQPPKKYIKDEEDGGGKLKLNPAYKAWKEGEANSNGNTVGNNNNDHNNHHSSTGGPRPKFYSVPPPPAATAAIHYPVAEAHVPTAIAIAEEVPPYLEETRSQIQASEQYQLQNRNNTTRPSQAEELRRWHLPPPPPSATDRELQRLRDENARLKTQQQYQQQYQQQQYQQYPPVFSQSMTTRPTPAPPMGMMTASLPPQQYRTYSPPPPSVIAPPHRGRRRRRRTPPRSQKPTMYAAQIPPGVAPGQQFQISIHGKQYRVTCPANTYVGQTIHVPISS